MGQTLFDRFAELLDDDQETAEVLHSEWVVDGQDPEEAIMSSSLLKRSPHEKSLRSYNF